MNRATTRAINRVATRVMNPVATRVMNPVANHARRVVEVSTVAIGDGTAGADGMISVDAEAVRAIVRRRPRLNIVRHRAGWIRRRLCSLL
jgi:hypothetical protein